MLAIDWAYKKELVLYDGEKITRTDHKGLGKYLNQEAVIEAGAPINLCWNIFRKTKLYYVLPTKTKEYREEHGIEKSDEADARVIWELAQDKSNLIEASINQRQMRLAMLYHMYLTYQKAQYGLENQIRAAKQYYGPYAEQLFGMELALDQLAPKHNGLLKEIELAAPKVPVRLAKMKGFGPRIWAGIVCIADPRQFTSINAYLKFCGFIDREKLENRFNRDAKLVYWLLTDQIVKQRGQPYRDLYDRIKQEQGELHPDWLNKSGYKEGKGRIDNIARNRVATMLAKEVYRLVRDSPLLVQKEPEYETIAQPRKVPRFWPQRLW